MRQVSSKLASRQFHQWLVPEKTVMGMFSLGVILIFIGAILLAVSSVASGALAIIGGILLAIGLILVFICIGLCTYSWCVWHVRDQETQTIQTTLVGTDQPDGDWYSTYGLDKKTPNGVLRDGRQPVGSLSKKHVTISPRSHDTISTGSGRQGDTFRSDYSRAGSKSGPGSVTSDMSTLASFAYLHDPTASTPYTTLDNKQQRQGQGYSQSQGHGYSQGQGQGYSQGQMSHDSRGQSIPIHVQSNYDYNSVPRSGVDGSSRTVSVRPYQGEQSSHVSRANVLPARRHSDDDYDNASDMTPMLPYQTFQPVSSSGQQQWHHQKQQQQQQQQQWQQQQHQQHGQWQQTQPPPQQTVWQYQHREAPSSQSSSWRQTNQTFEESAPTQPLVHPSARRPMTFEQISSSKVSLYDNIQMSRRRDEEEE